MIKTVGLWQYLIASDLFVLICEGVAVDNINITFCQPVNLVPHFWFYKIVDTEGKPDLPCIMILSEIFGWFRSLPKSNTYYSTGKSLPELVNGKLAISYDFLANKLNLQKERIRRNLVKLENASIISRDVKNITIKGGSRINQLYISIDLEFFKSCFRNPDFDIRVRNTAFASGDSTAFASSTQPGGEHIRKNIQNRSMNLVSVESKNKSNFINNNSINTSEGAGNKKALELPSPTTKTKNPWKQPKKKQLADFYPLSEEDCSILQRNSGREFSLNATNEILLDMSKRLGDKSFYSKQSFINYMAKCLSYEMRDAVKINNTNFKIRANQSKEEREATTEEKYLNKLEYSLQVSPEWHFKKKLAAVFERNKAYHLLTSYKQLIIEQNGVCRLVLDKPVNLTAHEQEIILSQLQASHTSAAGGVQINKLNIVTSRTTAYNASSSSSNQNKPEEGGAGSNKPNIETPKLLHNIWGTIRSSLIEHHGQSGVALDNHWFSKLNASIDTNNRNITLKAPTNFIKDWVQSQYSCLIDKICQTHNYSFGEVV